MGINNDNYDCALQSQTTRTEIVANSYDLHHHSRIVCH